MGTCENINSNRAQNYLECVILRVHMHAIVKFSGALQHNIHRTTAAAGVNLWGLWMFAVIGNSCLDSFSLSSVTSHLTPACTEDFDAIARGIPVSPANTSWLSTDKPLVATIIVRSTQAVNDSLGQFVFLELFYPPACDRIRGG